MYFTKIFVTFMVNHLTFEGEGGDLVRTHVNFLNH